MQKKLFVIYIFFYLVAASDIHAANRPLSLDIENATWEIKTHTGRIQNMIPSDDDSHVWVATSGGVEKRDAVTGERLALFTTLDGLPSNDVRTLASDGKGGIWAGTVSGGLAHRHSEGVWTVIDRTNSGLGKNDVKSIISDGSGGIWVASFGGGVTHYNAQGEWIYFGSGSGLPDDYINTVVNDSIGGVWIGTASSGVVHFDGKDKWQILNSEHSDIPDNDVQAILSDGSGGIWVATRGGLARFHADGSLIGMFDKGNSPLKDNYLQTLCSDGKGGIWIGSGSGDVVQLSADGKWNRINDRHPELTGTGIISLIMDSKGTLWIGTEGKGIFTLDFSDTLKQLDSNGTGVPDNRINSVISDNKGGIWVGTEKSGLAQFGADGLWKVSISDNSLHGYDYSILCLMNDGSGGVWVGTYGNGLAHRNSDGVWKVFNSGNSPLPDDYVNTILSDDQGGLWIGTRMGGVAHYRANISGNTSDSRSSGLLSSLSGGLSSSSSDGLWEIFNTQNSQLPDDDIRTLASDGKGGVWFGTNGGGLAHLDSSDTDANNKLLVINRDNSLLPSDKIRALLIDKQTGGLWIGTYGGGLAYLREGVASAGYVVDDSSNWEIFDYKTSELPDNYLTAIIDDGAGGIWIAMDGGGLDGGNSGITGAASFGGVVNLYKDSDGIYVWQKITRENSSLPDNQVQTMALDINNGLWIGSSGSGVARLYFGKKTEIVNTIENESLKKDILEGKIAAMIVAGGSSAATNTHWESTEKITSRVVYRAFHDRGYVNSEIYCLSPVSRMDFNADGCGDRIVDAPVTFADFGAGLFQERPVTMDDLQKAFEWAKSRGKLTQPFFIYMMTRGKQGATGVELELNSSGITGSTVTGEQMDAMIGDYQTSTGNKVVVIIEADYSGNLLASLSGADRVIITSAGENQTSYYGRTTESFSQAFCMNIAGNSLANAFKYTPDTMKEIYPGMGNEPPSPLLDDNGDGISDDFDGESLALNIGVNGIWGRKSSDEPEIVTSIHSGKPVYDLWDTISVYVQNRQNRGSGNYDQYTAMLLPDGTLFFFTAMNRITNSMFTRWEATPVVDDTDVSVLNMPIFFDLPAGQYWIYNLLVPAGKSPVTVPVEAWVVGSVSFEIR